MAISVRELPRLDLHHEITTPSGKRFRWGADEPNPRDVPSGVRFSSTMPGGHDSADATLPRKPGVDAPDLDRLSNWRIVGPGGAVAWEGRIERAPRVSGDQIAISPSAVGWKALLEDDQSANIIYIDRALDSWRENSRQRQVGQIGAGFSPQGFQARADSTTGSPSVANEIQAPWVAGAKAISEAWYDAGPKNLIGRIRATWTKTSTVDSADANWNWFAVLCASDADTSVSDATANLRGAGPGAVDLVATGDRRYALLETFYNAAAPAASEGKVYGINWTNVRVIGRHDLTLTGVGADEGVLASEVVADAVARWAPLLVINDDGIVPSTFVIPHLTFPEPTTAGEIVKQATRFGLQDWAVWDGKEFVWHPRGARGRSWRAWVGPAGLEETGPQADRLWNSVIVAFQDVDGSTRTVGPLGAGMDTEDSTLSDDDPENPANKLGINRRALLTMGISRPAAAVEVGRRFLEEQKLLDTSGRARITGHVMDSAGVVHPYWKIRAGDTISFVDAADTSPRRIVRADHDHDQRSCTVDLDSPPEGLQALLERLSVVLEPLGL